MNSRIRIIVLVIICTLFLGCKKDTSVFRVRGCLISADGSDVEMKVVVENESGDCLTGAVVLATDSSNDVTILDYDSDLCCYSATVDGLEENTYTIQVDSVSIGEIITLKIPHTRLLNKPVLVSLTDSKGNSVLSGATLSMDSSFYAAWDSCGENVVYKIAIKSPLETVWSSSSSSTNIEIPPNILKTGIYYFYITAQKIYGDPYFSSSNYYSVSSIQSSGIQFYAE